MRTSGFLLGLLALAGAGPAVAADGALARLERSLAETRDVTAEFVQTRHSPLLEKPLEGRGTLWLERPGKVRLEYRTPEPLTLLKRGDTAWVHAPTLRQVQRTRASAAGVPLEWVLGGSLADLRRHAEVRAIGDLVVELTARAESDWPWQRLRIHFAAGQVFPVRFEIEERSGERLDLRLRQARWNRGVPDARFAPRWPAGTAVHDLGP